MYARVRVVVVALWMLIPACVVSVVSEGSIRREGQLPFSVGAWLEPRDAKTGTDTLVVMVVGDYPKGTMARLDLKALAGIGMVSGEVSRALDLGRAEAWRVPIKRAQEAGKQQHGELLGSVVVGVANRRDEAEFRVEVAGDKTALEACRIVMLREERVEGGKRFRFGGPFLVPIDGSDTVTQRDIDGASGKPVLVHGDTLSGRAGAVSKFVVFVDSHGRVRDARAVDRSRVGASREAATRERIISEWRFRPAIAKGRAVPDWIIVSVPVGAGRD